MNRQLARRMAGLERRKAAMLSDVAGWTEARLRFRPEPTAWCALDMLDHLVKVEEAALGMVRARLGGGGSRVSGRDRVGAWIVGWVMRSPMRVSVPREASTVMPGAVVALPGIAARWDAVRERLARCAEGLTAEQRRAAVFAHPRSGAMTFAMALGFLQTHLQHHEHQLRRLRAGSRAA